MPRIGRNPLRKVAATPTKVRLTVAVLSCIPDPSGYWSQSLPVLNVCLASLRKNTGLPFELAVFDNGSCPAVCEHLARLNQANVIDTLILSKRNVGKVDAWNHLFGACQTELITYTDGDVLFMPGWAEESVRVLDEFPQAAMVTGRPWRASEARDLECMSSTLRYVENEPSVTVRRGDLIPHEILLEHALSIGRDRAPSLEAAPFPDIYITKNSVSAFAHAGHYQFTTRSAVAQSLLPITSGPTLSGAHEFDSWDRPLDAAGYLRLSLTEARVRHLGNRLDNEALAHEIADSLPGMSTAVAVSSSHRGPLARLFQATLRRLSRHTISRRVLQSLHNYLFDALASK